MRAPIALLFAFSLTGCGILGPSLAGNWAGEIDCDGEEYDIEVSLEKHDSKSDTYVGDGEIVDLTCSNSNGSWDCDMLFEVEVEADGGSGEQDLEFDLDDCEYKIEGEKIDADCIDLDDGEWDGKDLLEFETDGCDGELERDD